MPRILRAPGARAIRWVRGAALVVGLVLVAGGLAFGAGPYSDRRAFDRAPYCATSAGASHCIERIPATVLDRSAEEVEVPDPPNPEPPQPPQQPPPQPPPGPFGMASPSMRVSRIVAASTRTDYKVTVLVDGQRRRFDVDHDFYDAAKPHTTGTAEKWHGRLIRLRIGSQSIEKWSFFRLTIARLIVWTGLMVIIGLALPFAREGGQPLFFWWGGIVLHGVVPAWPPAWWTVLALAAALLLLYRVSMTRGSPRHDPW